MATNECEFMSEILTKIGFLGVTKVDYRAKRARISSGLLKILGIDSDKGGTTLSTLRATYNSDDLEWIKEVMSRQVDSENRSLVVEYRVRDRHNQERWIHERSHILSVGSSGRAQRVVCMLFDVTLYKQEGGRCLTNYRANYPDPAGDLVSGLGFALRAARQLKRPDLVADIDSLASDAVILATSPAYWLPGR